MVRICVAVVGLLLAGRLGTAVASGASMTRPEGPALAASIARSRSLVAKSTRAHLAEWIGRMDRAHLKVVSAVVDVQSTSDRRWIGERTTDCPRGMPRCERAVLAALRLQWDMLFERVKVDRPDVVKEVYHDRTHRRIKPDARRIFNDARDVFVDRVQAELRDIKRLHQILGVSDAGDVELSIKGSNMRAVEAELLAMIEQVALAAEAFSGAPAMERDDK